MDPTQEIQRREPCKLESKNRDKVFAYQLLSVGDDGFILYWDLIDMLGNPKKMDKERKELVCGTDDNPGFRLHKLEKMSSIRDVEWVPFFTLPLGRQIEKGGGDLGGTHLILETQDNSSKFWFASDQGELALINWTKTKVERPTKKGKSSLDIWKRSSEFVTQ